MKIFQSARLNGGKLAIPHEQFADRISTLPDGDCLIIVEWINPNKTIREYQKEYGAKRDLLCREQGYGRKDMDVLIYQSVLAPVLEEPEYRLSESQDLSTKSLSILGWKRFIESLRLWAWSTFECYL
jgi:hypothetical protein